jgi:hypothetical protein
MTDKDDLKIPVLPDHESGVRRMVADAAGGSYRAFRTLADAQADADGAVVFEGDYGGQIYLVCPARVVRCSEDALRALLQEIDELEWRDPEGARVFFEALPQRAPVPGGTGGGRVTGGLWVHERLREHADAIKAVLEGERAHLK